MSATKIGIAVYCETCGREKSPHGRSIAPEVASSYCDSDCDGYRQDPKPGCLFPGETDDDFGYECCSHATRPIVATGERGGEG